MNPTDPWSTIVGIVGDVHDVALDQSPSAIVYPALVTMSAAGTPWTPHSVAFAVRTARRPRERDGRRSSAPSGRSIRRCLCTA